MRVPSNFALLSVLLKVALLALLPAQAAVPPKKPHTVLLGAVKQVPYSKAGDPAGAGPDETTLKIRPLLVDGRVSEWTTGESHDVTDRSFVVRRSLRINDSLPGDKSPAQPDVKPEPNSGPKSDPKPALGPQPAHWVWQRGPWLLIDRLTGRVTALKLPDYDPAVSEVAWFRDYAAYCGVTATRKSLFAVVAQVGVRKPILAKKLSMYDAENHPWPVCGSPEWQRQPLHITFQPAGRDAAGFDLAGGSAMLVEEDDAEAAAKP
jgi:hypothetical protein